MKQLIDLKNCDTEEKVLSKIGEILDLGGTVGNNKKGWGHNWNALNDSLSYLDVGGIWGSSKILEFPLELVFTNFQSFQEKEPNGFKTLVEILEDKAELYKKSGQLFSFIFS